ncbi:MAG: zinc ABC transporter substrate-binding protein [Geminocystis sp.]
MKRISYPILKLFLILTIFNLVACNQEKISRSTQENTTEINQNQTENRQEKLNITVTIPPQKYFVEKIGGELVNVNVMIGPGLEPHTYEPQPQQLTSLAESSAYVAIGVPFEEVWLNKITTANPQIVMINSGEGINKIPLVGHDHDHNHENDNHNHEDEHNEDIEHNESNYTSETSSPDPHIWLSPKLAKIQAENIYQGLVKINPENQQIYQENLTKFLTEIDNIDQQIKEKLAPINNRKFFIYHPAWGYFAQEYNLQQIPLEFEGQEVTSQELSNLIKQAKAEKINTVFAQPQFNNKTMEIFAKEIGAEIVLLDDLAQNWSENMLSTADKLAKAMTNNTN